MEIQKNQFRAEVAAGIRWKKRFIPNGLALA